MSNQLIIEPQIKNNQRITRIGDLKSAKNLNKFIQQLDNNYDVDSSNPDNTFGRILMDHKIIQHHIDSLKYWAQINTFNENTIHLPKYTKDFKNSINIEKSDIQKLMTLRKNYANELEQHNQLNPKLPYDSDQYYDENKNESIQFSKITPVKRNRILDNLLKQQGFANDNEHSFTKQFIVPDIDGKPNIFQIDYYRLSNNKKPHLSMSYKDWQNQEEMDHKNPVYHFYKKWYIFHLHEMTIAEYNEMIDDINKLKLYLNSMTGENNA